MTVVKGIIEDCSVCLHSEENSIESSLTFGLNRLQRTLKGKLRKHNAYLKTGSQYHVRSCVALH